MPDKPTYYELERKTKALEEEIQRLLEQPPRLSQEKTAELEDVNTLLNVLLKKREEENQAMAKKVLANYQALVEPFFDNLNKSLLDETQKSLLYIIEANFKVVLSPFSKQLSDPLSRLTPAEMRIAVLVRQGMTNQEIAQTLNISVRTTETHRACIRKKLGLTNRKINLETYLQSLINT